MRKYRARQRSDPIRYQQYLERERKRNWKRKYEKRIQAAQEKAQELGIPYIVLKPPQARRGRKSKFGDDVSLVLPARYEDDIEDESNSFQSSDDMPVVPVEVELLELDELYQEQKQNMSALNKFIRQPRSALQTLLPQEVSDRERVSNFIKLEHDYVKQNYVGRQNRETFSMHHDLVRKLSVQRRHRSNKHELLQLQQQCKDFVSNRRVSDSSAKPKRRRRQPSKVTARKSSYDVVQDDCVEHEDLDDLFKELAEVATKNSPKKRHSSPHKKSSRKRSVLKQTHDDGQFSLVVSMPVQPLLASNFTTMNLKSEPTSPTDPCDIDESVDHRSSFKPIVRSQTLEKAVNNIDDVYCNEDSIEIKQEPANTDDDFY